MVVRSLRPGASTRVDPEAQLTVVTDDGVRLQAENQTATRHLRRNHEDVSYRGHMKCPRCGQTYTIADLDAKLAEVAKLGVSELDMSRLL